MKAKIKRGNSFRGLADYILSETKGSYIVGGNMISTSPRDLSKEFSVARKLRPDTKKPVWHVSLSLPVGESISDEKWGSVANRFLEMMEVDIEYHQFFAGKHTDTDKEHIHICMNRIGLNSELFHGRNDVKNAIKATNLLEKEFGLTITPTLNPDEKAEKSKPTSNEIQMADRTGELPSRLALQNILDEALSKQIDIFAFIELCESSGATVIPNVARTGRLNGFAFEYGGIKFKGSDLGNNYNYKNLKKTVIYEQDRQASELIEAASRIKQKLDSIDKNEPRKEQQESISDRRSDGENIRVSEVSSQSNEQLEPVGEDTKGIKQEAPIGSDTVQNGDRERAVHGSKQTTPSRGEADSSREELGEARIKHKVESESGLLDSRLDNWRRASDHIDDIVSPISSDLGKPKSANILKKESLWEQQHKALKADLYRITLIGRNGQKPWVLGKTKDGERFFNADEVKDKIPLLSKKNAEGRDIYITPRMRDYHYIVVDDLTPKTYQEMLRNDYKPNLVQESSKDNYQAIFRVPKSNDKDDKSIANRIVVGLNRKYGDENFTGVEHPFRLAGFSNKKPTRDNFFTRIINSTEKACRRVVSLLEQELQRVLKLRNEAELAKKDAEKAKLDALKNSKPYLQSERINIMNLANPTAKTASAVFARTWSKFHGLAQANNWPIDFSRIDYSVVKEMVTTGYSDTEINTAIVDCSPSVIDRKNDVQDYCNRTISKAKAEIEQKKNRSRANTLGR